MSINSYFKIITLKSNNYYLKNNHKMVNIKVKKRRVIENNCPTNEIEWRVFKEEKMNKKRLKSSRIRPLNKKLPAAVSST